MESRGRLLMMIHATTFDPRFDVLIATDVVARGIDFADVTLAARQRYSRLLHTRA